MEIQNPVGTKYFLLIYYYKPPSVHICTLRSAQLRLFLFDHSRLHLCVHIHHSKFSVTGVSLTS